MSDLNHDNYDNSQAGSSPQQGGDPAWKESAETQTPNNGYPGQQEPSQGYGPQQGQDPAQGQGYGYGQPGYQEPDRAQDGYYGYNQGPNQNSYYNLPNQGYPGYQQNGYQQNGYGQTEPPRRSNPMAVTSMLLGIFSIVTCCASPLGMILSIAGIVLAVLSKKGRPMSGFAIAGLVLSIVGILFSLIFFAYYMLVLSMMKDPRYASFFNEILEQYQMLQ